MGIITVGLGFMLLIAGRPIYMVFNACVGFVGSLLIMRYLPLPVGWSPLYVALFSAAVFGGLTYLIHRPLAWLCGAIAGVYLVLELPGVLGGSALAEGVTLYIIMAVAAVICVAALILLFDASLVVLSAMTAVTMILQYLRIALIPMVGMFFILLAFSLATQFLILQYGSPSPD
jgi:hypothetical protein